ELADDIANLELTGLQSFINLYDSNGSQFMNINGNIVEIEDQLYLSFLIPYYDNSIPLGTVLDAEVGLMIEPSKLAELQVVFGEIDDIEFDGLELTDNYLELYAFAGDSITLNPTVKSTNHTVEGFPVPQNITWTLYSNDTGVSLSENGVFTLNEPKNDYYNVLAVAEGGLNANITIAVARVALVYPAKDTV